MTAIAVQESLQRRKCEIVGTEIIGIDGYSERTGVVEAVSVNDNRVLGRLVQVWVRWDDNNSLEPFFPRQFKKYSPNSPIGVYCV